MNKRIHREINELQHLKEFEITRFNEYEYRVMFNGAKDTPYENVPIVLYYTFRDDHPFKPPHIVFKPHLFHPNINENGILQVDEITGTLFSPASTISTNLLQIVSLLQEPYVTTFIANTNALTIWNEDPIHFATLIRLSTILDV